MRRLLFIIISALFPLMAFAQNGNVGAENQLNPNAPYINPVIIAFLPIAINLSAQLTSFHPSFVDNFCIREWMEENKNLMDANI